MGFHQVNNDAVSTLAATYSTGGTTLTVASGHGSRFGSPTPSNPIYITCVTSATVHTDSEVRTHFEATGRTSDQLTGVSVVSGSTDRNFAIGDAIEMRLIDAHLEEIHAADLLKAVDADVVHDTGNETIAGTKTFSSSPIIPTPSAADNSTKAASTAYVDAAVAAAVVGLLDLKGSIDASSNPNYPSASKGDTYFISVAGKVGGVSGKSVDVGDAVVASADNAGGTEGSVGTSWFVIEHNLAGALLAANNLSDLASNTTARTNLGVPAKAPTTVDNTLPRHDGTTGDLQASGVSVDDNDAISGFKGAFNDQTGTTYTFQASDSGKAVTLTNASAITATIPNSLPKGWNVLVIQGGAGQVTFAAGSGATLNNRSGHTKAAGIHAQCSLLVTANGTGTAAVANLGGDTAS